MARSAVGDVRAGVVAAWPTISAGALAAAVPAASVYAGGLPAGPQVPYAQIVATKAGEPEFSMPLTTGSPYLQRINLVVKIWVAGAGGAAATDLLSPIVALVLAAFGNEAWTIPDTRLMASFPGEPDEVEDGKFNGEPVWRGDVPFQLLLQRWVK